MREAYTQQGLSVDGENRLLPLWEILSVTASALITEWVVLSLAPGNKLVLAVPLVLALTLMFFSHSERGEGLKELGFRFDNFIPALVSLLIPTVVAAAAIVIVAWWVRGSEFSFSPVRLRFLTLPIWALFQQYAVQGFVNRRAQLLWGRGLPSICLVAVFFGLLHLPNPLLTILTVLGGLIWAHAYQRAPNLFALALSHSALSLLLAISLSPNYAHGLRVGIKYFA